MEATISTGWIYDHRLLHAERVKVAHPLMLRAIAASKEKNDRIDAGKIADVRLPPHQGTRVPTTGATIRIERPSGKVFQHDGLEVRRQRFNLSESDRRA